MQAQLAENPHVKLFQNRRGYVRCTVSPEQWLAEYRSVPYVSRPGAPLETPSKWQLTRGTPGITRA
jgi:alkaline phosphatase D